MRDNLSIVILMILLVLVMIMFPLYNYFERQDDMSYSLALKATTNFVDEVLNSGYMDQEMYDEFVNKLADTGNMYDIQLEAHRKYKIKDPDNPISDRYVETSVIDYNDDIFETMQSSAATSVYKKQIFNSVYKLNENDEFYVKLKNSSVTMAGAIFNSLITTSSKDRIVVNYGGIVKNNSWQVVDATFNARKFYDDTIYYVEDDYKESNQDRFVITFYFKGISDGVSYDIEFKNITGGYSYINQAGSSKGGPILGTTNVKVDADGILIVSGIGKDIMSNGGKISFINHKTGLVPKLVAYETGYASKENLLLNLEREYKYLKIWPTLVNVKVDPSGTNVNIVKDNSEDKKNGAEVYSTRIVRDLSKAGQIKGSTMEILFTLSDTSSGVKHIIGDWETGGGGIMYITPAHIKNNTKYFNQIERLKEMTAKDQYIAKYQGVIAGELYVGDSYKWVACVAPYDISKKPVKVSLTSSYNKQANVTTLKLYVNGELMNTKKWSGPIKIPKDKNGKQVQIGIGGNLKTSTTYENPIYGTINSIQVYDKVLSDSEIKQNYDKTALDYVL